MTESLPARLHSAKARIEELRQRDLDISVEVGETMAAGGNPSSLRTERIELRAETEDLFALVTKLEQDLQLAKGALRLKIARAEQRLIPLKREIEALHASRVVIFAEGLRLAREKRPSVGFADQLASLEGSIASTIAQIAEINIEIQEHRGPLQVLESAPVGA